MKRSQANPNDDEARASRLRALLQTHTQLEADMVSLRVRISHAHDDLRLLSKQLIMEHYGKIGPFQPDYLTHLGSIVDFGCVYGAGDLSILIQRVRRDANHEDGYYWVRHDLISGDLVVITLYNADNGDDKDDGRKIETLKDISGNRCLEQYVRHTFIHASNGWEYCRHIDCACKDASSDTHEFREFVERHSQIIIGLMHDLHRLYKAFANEPQKTYDEIMSAVREHDDDEAKRKKHKK